MVDIRISENLFERASLAAKAENVSVEQFVAQAVQLRLQDDVLRLTPDQADKVRKGQAEIREGRFLTMDQLDERSAAIKAKWREDNPL